MAEALFEITPGRLAKTGGATTLSSQATKLDEVRFAQLDLDEPRQQFQVDAVSDDSAGGKEGRRIDGREGYPVERYRSLEDPGHVAG